MILRLRSRKAARPKKATAPSAAAESAPSALAPGEYEFSPALVVLSSPHSKEDDGIRRCVDNVIARHLEHGRRGLVLCGAAAGVGVTFTATNLAVALAESGVATLLVDANLRRPSLQDYIRPADAGLTLSRYLRDPAEPQYSDVIHDSVLPGLSLVYAGEAVDDAQELLTGERFRAFVRRAMREFACILVDVPPANRSADARLVASAVGYALIVARRNATYFDDVAQLTRELASDGVAVVGTVLNDA